MRADQLKEGDKIVMEVAEASPVLGAKDAWRISFKAPSWRRDFVQNAGGHICVNPEDEFDTPNNGASGPGPAAGPGYAGRTGSDDPLCQLRRIFQRLDWAEKLNEPLRTEKLRAMIAVGLDETAGKDFPNKPGERICEPSAGSKYAPLDGSEAGS